jgi:hypothetical protein
MEDAFKDFMTKAQEEKLNPMELSDNEMLEAVDEANMNALKLMDEIESPSGEENIPEQLKAIKTNLEAIKTNLEQYGAQLINSGKTESPMYDRIIKLGARIDLAIQKASIQ